MCFKVYIYQALGGIEETYDILYKNVRVFGKRGQDNFQFFLDAIRSLGGMEMFTTKADDLFRYLKPDNMVFLERSGFGLSFYGKTVNADLLDEVGDVIFRGEGWMMKLFLDVESTKGTEVWYLLKQQFWDRLIAVRSDVFEEAAAKLRALSFRVEKSAFGMSPDFRLTPEHLFKDAAGKTYGDILIKMTGSRALDYEDALKVAGLSPADTVGYTWHHLDDFNPDTGTCTMQLVKSIIHKQVDHTGAVRMWELLYGGATKTMKYAP